MAQHLLIAACALALTAPVAADDPADDDGPGSERFEAVIAPLLARRCLGCHNATDRKGGSTSRGGRRRSTARSSSPAARRKASSGTTSPAS